MLSDQNKQKNLKFINNYLVIPLNQQRYLKSELIIMVIKFFFRHIQYANKKLSVSLNKQLKISKINRFFRFKSK